MSKEITLVPLTIRHCLAWHKQNKDAFLPISDKRAKKHLKRAVKELPKINIFTPQLIDDYDEDGNELPDYDKITKDTKWKYAVHKDEWDWFAPTGLMQTSGVTVGSITTTLPEDYMAAHPDGPYTDEDVLPDGSSHIVYSVLGHIKFAGARDWCLDLGLQVCSRPFNLLANNAGSCTLAWVDKRWADEMECST